MSKPTKTEAELIAMARVELKVHADCPDGIAVSILRTGDSWEFRTAADEATVAKPGCPPTKRPPEGGLCVCRYLMSINRRVSIRYGRMPFLCAQAR